jgi:hypothetical protein
MFLRNNSESVLPNTISQYRSYLDPNLNSATTADLKKMKLVLILNPQHHSFYINVMILIIFRNQFFHFATGIGAGIVLSVLILTFLLQRKLKVSYF